MFYNLLKAAHALSMCILMSLSVDEILLARCIVSVFEFNSISIFVGYLIPKPFL